MSKSALQPEWLNSSMIRTCYGIPHSTLYELIKNDGFPKPVKIGRSSLWAKSAIDAWFANKASQVQ